MASDRARKMFGGGGDDRPSLGERLAEVRASLAALVGGDLSIVPPWSTPKVALADLRREEASYVAQLDIAVAG